MRKNFVNYFYGVITVIMLGAYMSISDCSNNQNKVEAVDSVETERVEETFDNVARADQLSEDIFSFICLVEGGVLNENTGENYHCGARWTTWYGVTTSPVSQNTTTNNTKYNHHPIKAAQAFKWASKCKKTSKI